MTGGCRSTKSTRRGLARTHLQRCRGLLPVEPHADQHFNLRSGNASRAQAREAAHINTLSMCIQTGEKKCVAKGRVAAAGHPPPLATAALPPPQRDPQRWPRPSPPPARAAGAPPDPLGAAAAPSPPPPLPRETAGPCCQLPCATEGRLGRAETERQRASTAGVRKLSGHERGPCCPRSLRCLPPEAPSSSSSSTDPISGVSFPTAFSASTQSHAGNCGGGWCMPGERQPERRPSAALQRRRFN